MVTKVILLSSFSSLWLKVESNLEDAFFQIQRLNVWAAGFKFKNSISWSWRWKMRLINKFILVKWAQLELMVWISIGFFKTEPISIFSEYLEQAEQQSERSSLDKPISSCEYIVLYLHIKIYPTLSSLQLPSLAQKSRINLNKLLCLATQTASSQYDPVNGK